MDDYRFRAQQSPRTQAPMNSLVSPPRNGGVSRIPQATTHDPRTTLPRRFTTDSGRVPTLSTITTQRPTEPQEYPTAQQYKAQLLQKKTLEYEKLVEQKRRFEAEMAKLEQQQLMDELELAQMQEDLGRGNPGLGLTGHQSEPTTPPEYRDTSSGFPTMFSRPNRYSTSSLASPPGLFNRPARSGSQLASPQSGFMNSRFAFEESIPSRSVPGTRRNSDEDEKEEALRQDPTSHRSTNALNRYSMPVTRRGNLYDNIDQTNSAAFLFRDDEATMDNNFATMEAGDDNFPKLFSQKGNPNRLSVSSAAADLASMASSDNHNGWGKMATSMHRPQQSMSTLSASQLNSDSGPSSATNASSDTSTGSRQANFRRSLDLKQHGMDPTFFTKDTAADVSPGMASPSSTVMTTPPKLQASFSANDIPTVKNVGAGASNVALNANAHAQQHFHNHNASMGRIPPGALKRHSRELSTENHVPVTQSAAFASIGSTLHANAPAFGPATTQGLAQAANVAPAVTSPSSAGLPYQGFYPNGAYNPSAPNGTNYNMNMLAMGMNNMNMNGYQPQHYNGYAPMYQNGGQRDSQQRVIQQRRNQDNEAMTRFNNLPLESVGGNIFELCKDQHGCRYLQKQLENRVPEQVHMIWVETCNHVVELMTDPFGNYLCQKLLEYCNDDERTVLIQNASEAMVRIALNQHGTRALQKMIEFVTTREHVQIIVEALRYQVVELIQDLNGNHVIQKCLNKLSAQDAEFIFDAVGNHCIEVGTHRHGCCVLQRCIDHATGDKKIWLIARITDNALRLVKDPFGNYVVQYIIDLNEPTFTEPLVKMFGGQVGELSRHKFSSNVIEKCFRCASEQSRDAMAAEILHPGEMERLLRDSFGNYVVQTALEHSSFQMKHQLVEGIRPILPTVRSTPYGRRLQAKIQQYDSRTGSGHSSGQTTPADPTGGQISLRAAHNRGVPNNGTILTNPAFSNGINSAGRGHSGTFPQANGLAAAPPQPPRLNQVYTYPGAGVQSGNGEGQFF